MTDEARAYVLRDELARAKFVRLLNRAAIRDRDSKPLVVTVRRHKPRRSLSQNALFHSWCHILAVATGDSDEDMKFNLKQALLPTFDVTNRFTGEVRTEPQHTARLNKVDFAEFLTRVQALAIEHFSITLPTPDDPASWEAFLEQDAA